MASKLFLLDAYALIYRGYWALSKNPRINSKGVDTTAILGFVNTLEEVLREERPEYIAVAFDPKGGTFRHEVYPAYKAQREKTPEGIEIGVPYIKKILNAYNIPVFEIPGFEADDVIGTLAEQASKTDVITYMMTPDKDYGQLVKDNVFMYSPNHIGHGFTIKGPKAIMEKYGITSPTQVIDLLGLMGDSSDNIPGCPNVGEVTAVKLIKQFGSVENLLEHTNELKGAIKVRVEENAEQIRFSKFLATIKTDVPVTLNLDELRKKDINREEVRRLFEELEFRSLLKRVLGDFQPQPRQLDLFSGDLFANIPNEGTDNPEKSQFQELKDVNHNYKLVETEQEIDQLVQKFLISDFVCLDTETTSLNTIDAELVGLSFSVKENEAFYVPIPREFDAAKKTVGKFREIYENEKIVKIGQNLKYDMEVLLNYGIELRGRMFDTMLAHYLLFPEMKHNMDEMARNYLDYDPIPIERLIGSGKQQKNMRDLKPEEVYEYAAEDADVTLKLKNVFEKMLREEGLMELFETIEMPLLPVLVRMERNGVRIDENSLRETSLDFSHRMQEIEEEVYQLADKKFNVSSPKQVGELLFEKLHLLAKPKKTKTGQYATSEEVLIPLKKLHPVVGKILDYRGYKKLLSTYIDALPLLVSKKTGYIHTSYNQAVTSTGRLSSSDPNLQNIPVREDIGKEVRKAFIPDDGCLFLSADYSQIELRIMAHLSGDENMIEAFREGRDIHAATAAKIYRIPLEEVTKDQRRKAKTANFGIIYGITTFGLAERMEVSRGEARELIDNYFQTYPKVKEYMDKSIEQGREKGYAETIFGRRCPLSKINSLNASERGNAERVAINAPIQGTAADIIKIAMIRVDRRMREEGLRSKLILQVHDELNFSVVPEEKEILERIVREEMESAYQMQVPLIVDCGWGDNWLEAH